MLWRCHIYSKKKNNNKKKYPCVRAHVNMRMLFILIFFSYFPYKNIKNIREFQDQFCDFLFFVCFCLHIIRKSRIIIPVHDIHMLYLELHLSVHIPIFWLSSKQSTKKRTIMNLSTWLVDFWMLLWISCLITFLIIVFFYLICFSRLFY